MALSPTASAQEEEQIVRLAKLVIDSVYLDSYKVFLKEAGYGKSRVSLLDMQYPKRKSQRILRFLKRTEPRQENVVHGRLFQVVLNRLPTTAIFLPDEKDMSRED